MSSKLSNQPLLVGFCLLILRVKPSKGIYYFLLHIYVHSVTHSLQQVLHVKDTSAQALQAAFGFLLPYVLFNQLGCHSVFLKYEDVQRSRRQLRRVPTSLIPRMYQERIDSNQEASYPLSPLKSQGDISHSVRSLWNMLNQQYSLMRIRLIWQKMQNTFSISPHCSFNLISSG